MSLISYRRLSRLKIIGIILIGLILYNEILPHFLKSSTWKKVGTKSDDSIKILLVADPQTLSTKTEPLYPFSYVAVWDVNRILSRGFKYALQYTNADVIIFLGDLMNDGSIFTDSEFRRHSNEFKSLFAAPSSIPFYIPGDNDIGGEGFDQVTPEKMERFIYHFNSTNPTNYKFIQLYHLSAIPGARMEPPLNHTRKNVFPILFSHFSLTPGVRRGIIEQVEALKPALIFSAHDHDSYEFISKKDSPKAEQFWLLREESKVLTFDLNSKDLHEISVPTCSYRMGRDEYGFGFAEISKSGTVHYTVLWLPSRFYHLWLYFWGLCVCIAMMIYPILMTLTGRTRKFSTL